MAEDFGGFGRRAASTAAKTGLGFWGWLVGLLGTPFLVGIVLLAGLVFLAAIIGGSGDSDDAGITASETTCQADGDSNIPKEYRDDVAQAAKRSGFPAAIIAAQLDTESGWKTHAVSYMGAKGISQFMPDTWKEVMGDADPFDPHKGIEAQGKYMGSLRGQMKKHFKLKADDPKLVDYSLAAYNAGAGAVEASGGVPKNHDTPPYVKLIKTLAQNKYSKSCKIVTVGETTGKGKGEVIGNIGSGKWVNPFPNSSISSPYGPRKLRGLTFHYGIDLAGASRESLAVTDMEITHVWKPGVGYGAYYGHGFVARQISAPHYVFEYHEGCSVLVKEGQKVAAGTKVLDNHCTSGNSSGIHLHFQVDPPGSPTNGAGEVKTTIDPLPILKKAGAWK